MYKASIPLGVVFESTVFVINRLPPALQMGRPYLIQLNDSELVGCMPYLVRLVGKSRKAGPVVKSTMLSTS